MNIIGNKIGLTINLFIDGKTYQKKCKDQAESDALFKAILKAKETQKEEDLADVLGLLNPLKKIMVNEFIEKNDKGEYYLKGYSTPMPKLLVDTIIDYVENKYPVSALINFWKLLMLNPDKVIINSLFSFLQEYRFAITDNGYFTGYKWVQNFSNGFDQTLIKFIKEKHDKLKSWKKSPKNFIVSASNEGKYVVTEISNKQNPEMEIKNSLGTLSDLYNKVTDPNYVSEKKIFTDCYNQTTRIILGVPVRKERKHEAHSIECSSNGLHVGSTNYIKHFSGNELLLVLINPSHVIHIPSSETSKLRTAEYFPFAIVDAKDKQNPKVLEQSYFETDYINYEKSKIEEDLALIASKGEISSTEKAEYKILLEDRLSALNEILKKRVVDIKKSLKID